MTHLSSCFITYIIQKVCSYWPNYSMGKIMWEITSLTTIFQTQQIFYAITVLTLNLQSFFPYCHNNLILWRSSWKKSIVLIFVFWITWLKILMFWKFLQAIYQTQMYLVARCPVDVPCQFFRLIYLYIFLCILTFIFGLVHNYEGILKRVLFSRAMFSNFVYSHHETINT